MAATALTVTAVGRGGAAISTSNADTSNGNSFKNTGREYLYLSNPGASEATVTIATAITVDGQAVGDRAVVLPAGAAKIVGPFPPEWYNDADRLVQLTITGTGAADVDLMAFR